VYKRAQPACDLLVAWFQGAGLKQQPAGDDGVQSTCSLRAAGQGMACGV